MVRRWRRRLQRSYLARVLQLFLGVAKFVFLFLVQVLVLKFVTSGLSAWTRTPQGSVPQAAGKRKAELEIGASACKCGAEYVNPRHFMWECKEATAVKARTGFFRPPETDQERKVLMPSCVPYKAESNFEALTTTLTTALRQLQANGRQWPQMETVRGKKSVTRRGSAGLDIGNPNGTTVWKGGELLRGADQTAMATEVAAGGEKKQENSVTGGQLGSMQPAQTPPSEKEEPRQQNPKPILVFGNLRVTRQRKACSRPAGARRTGKGQSGGLNDMADKAARTGLAQVKESVLVMEEKIEEDHK